MGKGGKVPIDRGEYAPGHEVMPRVKIDGDIAHISGLRDTIFHGVGDKEAKWVDHTCDLREVTNLWVFFGYFNSNFQGAAHSELIFEFADNRNLTASFEIRPLVGQHFSISEGFKKSFEIALRWTTERDAMLRRVLAKKVDTQMHIFEADITHSKIIDLFHAAARRTNELADTSEWYNTVRNSCTTNLVDLVHETLPGQLRKTPRIVVPGYVPKLWAKNGVIKLDGTYEETKAAALVNDRCLEIGNAPDFSAQLHGRL